MLQSSDQYQSRYFSQSYREARSKFIEGCKASGLGIQTFSHPLLGKDGELLAIDVAVQGANDASTMLIISSGCHGVEGFCGSGIQSAMLHDQAWQQTVSASGVTVLYIHAINPYGFSWWRRTTENNVDLNRNFQDFTKQRPTNARYDELADLLVPHEWPPSTATERALHAYIAKHGVRSFQDAVSSGQYSQANGLFYGGIQPEWSQTAVRQILRTHASRCTRLAWIDLHSGLGPSGHGEKIYAGKNDQASLNRARGWWHDVVTSTYDGSSTSSQIDGLMLMAAYEECPQAEFTGMTLEYGTQPIMDILSALRAEQWLANNPNADVVTHSAIKRQMRDAFYVDNDEWKHSVVAQGIQAANEALTGLS
jgi:predicted deacylase